MMDLAMCVQSYDNLNLAWVRLPFSGRLTKLNSTILLPVIIDLFSKIDLAWLSLTQQ